MTWFQSTRSRYGAVGLGSAILGFLLAWPLFVSAQDKKDPAPDPAAKQAPPAGGPTEANKDLVEQIKQLNARVAQAEATLKQGLKAEGVPPVKGGPADKPDKAEGVPPVKGGPADKAEGVPPGKRISAKFQNCAECHQKRPSGPLPPSHLEVAGVSDKGAKQDDKTGTGDDKTPAADPAAKTAVPAAKTADASKELADQIRQLSAKVARLEAALNQDPKATPSGAPDKGAKQDDKAGTGDNKTPADGKAGMGDKGMGMGMGMKDKGMDMKEKGMGMKEKGMGMKEKGMGMGMGMKEKGMGMGMDMKEKGMGMKEMMGKGPKDAGGMAGMKDMTKMQKGTALPAFPGAAEIYHIGASGFFLDQSDAIKLTTEQQTTLNSLKEKALLEKSTLDRKLDESEQELWSLSGSDRPDATKIDATVRGIEKLRGDQRLAFIRTVGEAAKVLTDDQRKILIGQATTAPPPTTAPATPPKTP